MKINNIYQGDCLAVLKTFPDDCINMVMTSPPYWSLRDYKVEGQLGLEPTFIEYIDNLCNIFDEVKRVLRKDGTCFANIGDSYSNSGKGGDSGRMCATRHTEFGKISDIRRHGKPTRCRDLPPKSLCNIPARFSIEMQNRGWILRNIIIWFKSNCMPSSVKDRFTVDFEYLFFFVKSKNYWFEQQFEPLQESSLVRSKYAVRSLKSDTGVYGGMNLKNQRKAFDKMLSPDYQGRNKRTVWEIATRSFKGNHFAIYPEELCITPIKAGCPEGGIVLDPFSGAGTTAFVAKKLDRNFIGIELNPEYVTMSEKRLHDEIGLFLNTGVK